MYGLRRRAGRLGVGGVYLEHSNGARAYREAGYSTSGWSNKAIASQAHKILRRPGIVRRLKQAHDTLLRRTDYTLEKAVEGALADRDKAEELGQMGAAVSARKLASQLLGHLVERKLNIPDKDDPVRKLMGDIAGNSRYMPDAAVHNAEQQRLAELAKAQSIEVAEESDDDEPLMH